MALANHGNLLTGFTLASAYTAGNYNSTGFVLNRGASSLPATPFRLVITDSITPANTATYWITSVNTGTQTLTSTVGAIEGTTDQNFHAGDSCALLITAGDLDDLKNAVTPTVPNAASFAGTNQGTATAISAPTQPASPVFALFNGGTGGAELPTAVAGMRVSVENATATAATIYPASGAQIDALGTNAGATLLPGRAMTFWAASSTQWYRDGYAGLPQFYTTTTNTTITIPPNATYCDIECISPGGGGGSGARSPGGTNAYGGGGGGGGTYNKGRFRAADLLALGSTITITLPAGGAGGAVVTADGTSGNAGTTPANVTCVVGSTTIWKQAGGNAGSGGTTTTGANGGQSIGQFAGAAGGASNVTGTAANGTGNSGIGVAAPGGGGGGGVSAALTAFAGGNGGATTWPVNAISGAFGGAANGGSSTGNGANGAASPASGMSGVAPGAGGGGGGGSSTSPGTPPGSGGNGGSYGAGGGGGGGMLNGTTIVGSQGAGGNGGSGVMVIAFV